MEDVAIQVAEEDQAIALDNKRLAQEVNAKRYEALVSRVKIVNLDRQVANAGILHLIRSALAD
jgi:hypothetical protein